MPTTNEDPGTSGPESRDSGSGRPLGPVQTASLFEEELSELRGRLKWTQAELGQFFGVSRVSISRWESRGVGESEPRKAALRLVAGCVEASPAAAPRVGSALLRAGLVSAVTAAVHRSPQVDEGRRRDPVDWQKVIAVREVLGWTQAELAAFLGVTHSVPAVWERPGSSLDKAVRAALLALELAADPEHREYPAPDRPMETLRREGLGAFYREAAELQVRAESPTA
jgi:transcriptional regulator with XRE-family HTH domain